MTQDFSPEDTFNGDEFSLFWRILPNKSYTLKGKKFKTGKKSKERISVFVGSNMTGSEKLKLLVIGRAKKPHYFRGKESIPIIDRNNLSSWMTTETFTEFLHNLNKRMIKENRKIALILENCSSHLFLPLSNVKLIFLPHNTTSRLQAMYMGIIHSIKSNYRLKLARKLLVLLDTKSNPTIKNIDLYDALIMLKDSWDEVSIETIKNCFVKSSLKFTNTDLEIDENENESGDYIWNELSERIA